MPDAAGVKVRWALSFLIFPRLGVRCQVSLLTNDVMSGVTLSSLFRRKVALMINDFFQ